MMTGPLIGTLRRPLTFGRKRIIKNGVKKARKNAYGTFIDAPSTFLITLGDQFSRNTLDMTLWESDAYPK